MFVVIVLQTVTYDKNVLLMKRDKCDVLIQLLAESFRGFVQLKLENTYVKGLFSYYSPFNLIISQLKWPADNLS